MPRWSPEGDWIASGRRMVFESSDGKSTLNLTSANSWYTGLEGWQPVDRHLQNTTGNGAQWQLYSLNVKTGAEKFLAPITFPLRLIV